MPENYPLKWPEGWIRTRIQDRKAQTAWKKPLAASRDALLKEFDRMGTLSVLITSNIQHLEGHVNAGMEPRDPGVAVYFSRTHKEDYSWQDALDLHSPAPSLEEVSRKYRELAQKYHPDNKTTGDIELFKTLTRHRDNAIAWINRREGTAHDYVIACDQFKEVRLNLAAIRLTVAAIRQIERCGTSSLLERAFQGFAALNEGKGVTSAAAQSASS